MDLFEEAHLDYNELTWLEPEQASVSRKRHLDVENNPYKIVEKKTETGKTFTVRWETAKLKVLFPVVDSFLGEIKATTQRGPFSLPEECSHYIAVYLDVLRFSQEVETGRENRLDVFVTVRDNFLAVCNIKSESQLTADYHRGCDALG